MLRLRRSATLGLAIALLLTAASVSEARRIDPMWVLDGPHSVSVPVGFASLAGSFSFPIAGGDASLTLNYDGRGGVAGGGFAAIPDEGGSSLTNYVLVGTFAVDPVSHVQSLHLADAVRSPRFEFDGTVSADAMDVVGTFVRRAEFLGLTSGESGALTLHRTSGPAKTEFVLTFAARMDSRGRIRGALDGRAETKGEVTVFGTHLEGQQVVDTKVTGGKIRGAVKTDKFAQTTAKLTIAGRGWKATLTGPVDQSGFHAMFDFTGAGFKVKGAPVTLAVRVGAPPPPPIPPKNLLTGAQATIAAGKVTIVHARTPTKFFGRAARLQIEFPTSDAQAIVDGHLFVHADPASSALAEPGARRCTVTISGRDYGTATSPADVTLDIRRVDLVHGGRVQVLATGTVVAANGTKKTVDVLVEAIVL